LKLVPSTAQPAPETDEKKSRGLGSYVLWGFVVVVLYVLSAGPVEWFRGGVFSAHRSSTLFHFYAPWRWAYIHTPFQRPLGMYLHLWRPNIWDSHGKSYYVH
jgi:hypothetical protein